VDVALSPSRMRDLAVNEKPLIQFDSVSPDPHESNARLAHFAPESSLGVH